MGSYHTTLKVQQPWSWRVCLLIVALAVTVDVSLVQFPLAWVAGAGIIAVLSQFRSPLSGLAVVIFTCGLLNYSPFETGALSRLFPGNVAIAIFLLAWFMSSNSWSAGRLFPANAIRRPLMGMAVVAPMSMLWSRLHPDPEVTYSFPHSDVSWVTAQLSQLVLLAATVCLPFAVAAGIKRWRDVETVVLTVGTVVAIGTMLTLGGLLYGFGSSYTILGATRAYFSQPWYSSMEPLTALCLPFLYSAVLFGRDAVSRYRLMCVLCALCLAGVVLTFSRETWLLAFCALLLVSISWIRLRVSPMFALLIVFAGAIVLAGVIVLASSFYNPDEVYGLERIYYYLTALQLFSTHPLLGVGAGNYQFFDRSYEGEAAGGIAHNQFLTTAAETGLLGLVMFLWLVLAILKIRRQLRSPAEPPDDSHRWVKVAGSAFLLTWIAECFFQEAFFASAAAGGGMSVMTVIVFPWTLLGVLLATRNLSPAAATADN